MRVLFADSNHPILHELLQAAGFSCDLLWDLDAASLIAAMPAYDALVIRSKFKIDKHIIDQCPRLVCIGRVGAGMENIDVAYAEKKGITCLHVPEGNRDALGEHALGMLLMLLNHLKRADAEVRQGIWRRAENRGTELGDKCVGIIGYGNMGKSFAKKLSGIGCRVLAYDKYLTAYSDQYATACSLQQLFAEADVVSIHVPLTEETTYLMNAHFFSSFAKSVYVVNTARGKCLHTEALCAALDSGQVLGACLDVLEYESLSFENLSADKLPPAFTYLLQSDKVILSPHIAGWSHESNYKMSKILAEKMMVTLNAKS